MTKKTYDVLVVGGGLAGTSAAYALAKRSLRVLLVDCREDLATQASGNRFGLIMPYITDRYSPFERLYAAGFTFTHHALTKVFAEHTLFRDTGGVQLPATDRLAKLLDSSAPLIAPTQVTRLSRQDASDAIGVPSTQGCFHVPGGGYVQPAAFARALCIDNVSIQLSTKVHSIRQQGDAWNCELSDGSLIAAPSIVVCAAYRAHGFPLLADLPLEPVHGQTIAIPSSRTSSRLQTLICFDGYVTPAEHGSHLMGAHYQHFDLRQIPSDDDSQAIVSRAQHWLPSLQFADASAPSARVCFRTSTFDRLPYIGEALDTTAMLREANTFRSGTDLVSKVGAIPLPGVFVSIGHGSRGLLSCPLGGEIIARLVTKEPVGSFAEVAQITAPQRVTGRLLSTAPAQRG